ncbi:alginate O-acetyltransferase AlgX-related protein [Primorskyibacter sp. S87]|uniref:alginate O-acetyltransferase AlgX-related protein n=1 Tax=Primorskyibacter sp. S87 TaxID=3415126 RepID=UPI003C7A55A3
MTKHSPYRRPIVLALMSVICLGLLGLLLLWTAAPIKSEEMLFGLWRLRHVLMAGILFVTAIGFLCAARGRDAFLGFLAAMVPIVGLGVLLEVSGRVGLVDWAGLLGKDQRPAETIGWTLQPGIEVRGETGQDTATLLRIPHDPIPFTYATDVYGFRNGSEPEGKIVILGDSIVLGAAVPTEQTVSELTEEALSRPVMQAALLGLSIQAEHEMLLGSGLALDGKTVVQFLFEGNDLLDSRAFREASGPVDNSGGRMSLARIGWEGAVRASNPPAPYRTCDIDGQVFAFLWTRQSFDGVEGELSHIEQSILEFRTRLEAVGARYALVLVPSKYRVLHRLCTFPPESLIADPALNLSDLPEQLAAWSRENEIDLLDLTGPLIDKARSGVSPWFWGDTHWNATGHAVAASALAEWLSENL